MKATEFCYWLQGYFELSKTVDHREGATPETMAMIERHLALVFKHDIDPQAGPPEVQAELQAIHDGEPTIGGVDLSALVMRC